MKPTPFSILNLNMNAEEAAIEDIKKSQSLFDRVLNSHNVNETLSPSEFDEFGYPKKEYGGIPDLGEYTPGFYDPLIKTAGKYGPGLVGTVGGGYVLAQAAARLSKYPFARSQFFRNMQDASTRIEGYYNNKKLFERGKVFPGVFSTSKGTDYKNIPDLFGGRKIQEKIGKVLLTIDHMMDPEGPAVRQFLEEFKEGGKTGLVHKTRGMTEEQMLREFKNLLIPIKEGHHKGAIPAKLFGLGGVENMNEFLQAIRLEEAENALDILRSNNMDDEQISFWKKEKAKASKMLRYETQKTELIKNARGVPINKERWKASGLGPITNTRLGYALKGNTRAIADWVNSSQFLAPDTKVTMSHFDAKDRRQLFKDVKNFGKIYLPVDKTIESLPPVQAEMYGSTMGGKPKQRVGGIFNWSKQAFEFYERGMKEYLEKHKGKPFLSLIHAKNYAFENYVAPMIDEIKKQSEESYKLGDLNSGEIKKHRDMIDQLRNNVDMDVSNPKQIRMRVGFSNVTNQQTVAGVNTVFDFWRSPHKRAVSESFRKIPELSTAIPGSIKHSILVSDVYDTFGLPDHLATNTHVNVAYTSNVQKDPKLFKTPKMTHQKIIEQMSEKDLRGLLETVTDPKMLKRVSARLARLAVFKK